MEYNYDYNYQPKSDEYYAAKREERHYQSWRRKIMRTQKLMGAGMVILNLLVPTGAAVLLIPMGLWLMFSKHINIYV